VVEQVVEHRVFRHEYFRDFHVRVMPKK
jgi:hypothetical protein